YGGTSHALPGRGGGGGRAVRRDGPVPAGAGAGRPRAGQGRDAGGGVPGRAGRGGPRRADEDGAGGRQKAGNPPRAEGVRGGDDETPTLGGQERTSVEDGAESGPQPQ